jgi:hypothetical protein
MGWVSAVRAPVIVVVGFGVGMFCVSVCVRGGGRGRWDEYRHWGDCGDVSRDRFGDGDRVDFDGRWRRWTGWECVGTAGGHAVGERGVELGVGGAWGRGALRGFWWGGGWDGFVVRFGDDSVCV